MRVIQFPDMPVDFSDLLGRTFPLATIFDPATTRPVSSGYVRDPFPVT